MENILGYRLLKFVVKHIRHAVVFNLGWEDMYHETGAKVNAAWGAEGMLTGPNVIAFIFECYLDFTFKSFVTTQRRLGA